MGPSDLILYTPAAIEFYLRRHVPADSVGALMDRLFDSQGVSEERRSPRCTARSAT